MFSLNRKHLAVGSCSLVVGILIGIAIDAALRPNHIRLWVDGSDGIQDLSIAPEEGDVIEWKALDESKGPMTVKFFGGNPCVGNTNPCTIGTIPDSAGYIYDCADTNKTYLCPDPAIGPKSTTNPHIAKFKKFFNKLNGPFQTILFKITTFSLGFFSRVTSATPGASITNSAFKNEINSTNANSQETKLLDGSTPLLAEISCDSTNNNVTTVTPIHGDPGGDIKVNKGRVINGVVLPVINFP